MRNDLHKLSVSWVTIHVVASPAATFVSAWNSHTIPGRNGGVPYILAARTRQISPIPQSQVPSVSEAVTLHEATGGRLTRESTYGVDPLNMHPQLKALRERDFSAAFPSMEVVFSDVVHNNGMMLEQAIMMFISLSLCFSELVDT